MAAALLVGRHWISPRRSLIGIGIDFLGKKIASSCSPAIIIGKREFFSNPKNRYERLLAYGQKNPTVWRERLRTEYMDTSYFGSRRSYFPLTREIIELISSKRKEPDWMLEFRLNALEEFSAMDEPRVFAICNNVLDFPEIFEDIRDNLVRNLNANVDVNAVDFVSDSDSDSDSGGGGGESKHDDDPDAPDPELMEYCDSVSLQLKGSGVILCPISEAVRKYPELVKGYLGTVVPPDDNFFAALNSTAFRQGTFVYVPKNVKCPIRILTPTRTIETNKLTNFWRTLVVAEEGSYVEYSEGGPAFCELLSCGVVELYCHDRAMIKYFRAQRWTEGKGLPGFQTYFYDTKNGVCEGSDSNISWVQADKGSPYGRVPRPDSKLRFS